ncbi:MAG: DEAD/DEAH box helicase [Candidatus Coatesbacteria bacterium]|nr:DEAD/DEAH box helicase [Candidatus Coatesbacteria bacterium]
MENTIDIFNIYESIRNDYKSYIKTPVNLKNEKIKDFLDEEFEKRVCFPEPYIKFNPAFKTGSTIEELCRKESLDKELSNIFKIPRLFQHQIEGIKKGVKEEDFIVTSGTGSGKSLIYFFSIVNYALKRKEKGIKGIVVYPMNALINSQNKEMERYINNSEIKYPISCRIYTGQESKVEKDEIQENPPDIILTNYVMLDLILTRASESVLRESIFNNLKFLVLDELHTYRGRQGSDVAILIRRLSSKARQKLVFIGTSATMTSEKDLHQDKKKIADVATLIFGRPFETNSIIDETLSKYFLYSESISKNDLLKDIINFSSARITENTENIKKSLFACWLENEIALIEKDGVLRRNEPMRFNEIAEKLAEKIGRDIDFCISRIKELLHSITQINKKFNQAYLPFKLHQFIAPKGAIYATLNRDYLDVKAEAGNEIGKTFFPVVFSRLSGYEFYCVKLSKDKLIPREFADSFDEEDNEESGYIIPYQDVWDDTEKENLPVEWFDFKGSEQIIKKEIEKRLPRRIFFNSDCRFSYSQEKDLDYSGWYMPCNLLFDPTSKEFYSKYTKERTKLLRLGDEGRSTASDIIVLSTLKSMQKSELSKEESKVLCFIDNRQDAAFQSGHFNSFVENIRLRSAIYAAVKSSNEGLDYSNIGNHVLQALNLEQKDYARSPSDIASKKKENEDVFVNYLLYKIIDDLRFEWKTAFPNLEQCALLEIEYKNLKEISEDVFTGKCKIFNGITKEKRQELLFQIFDYFRKNYAIYSESLMNYGKIDINMKRINELLSEEYRFENDNKIDEPYIFTIRSIKKARKVRYAKTLGFQSYLGKYLRNELKENTYLLNKDEYALCMEELFDVLSKNGFLRKDKLYSNNEEIFTYQLELNNIVWKRGNEKTVLPDPVRTPFRSTLEILPNEYFQNLYRESFFIPITAREHTGQISSEKRREIEEEFRKGNVNALFCSPTMELGIDISTLNVVYMRNVPPSPSNYAQRSGRAGRSGQPAIIFTYCTPFSPHDRHYFANSREMVSGTVKTANMDLTNKELLETHLNSICLSYANLDLRNSLRDIVDIEKEGLPLKEESKQQLNLNNATKKEIFDVFSRVTEDIRNNHPKDLSWLNPEWINNQIDHLCDNFDMALKRFRELYSSANAQLKTALNDMQNHFLKKTSEKWIDAEIRVKQAKIQLDFLMNDSKNKGSSYNSDFYPYRYLASEGFLPGFNFSRLPIWTYISDGIKGEYISRARGIAINESGPQNLIYHSGSKYRITKMILPTEERDVLNRIEKAKVCRNTGYIMIKDEFSKDICPFCQKTFNDTQPLVNLNNLIELQNMKTERSSRISCEEENRISKGYEIKTLFASPDGLEKATEILIGDLFKARYIPSALLYRVNSKWTTKDEEGFLLNYKNGDWGSEKETGNQDFRRVKLYTTFISDIIYLEPTDAINIEEWNSGGNITFLYSLISGINKEYNAEEGEIGGEMIGEGNKRNILLFENVEGSLGILKSFTEEFKRFTNVFANAYEICRFDDEEYKDLASYDDLLSYYNQRHHNEIDRFKIKELLDVLIKSRITIKQTLSNESYEEQHERIRSKVDKNSATESVFLEFLFKNGLKLPDDAQVRTKDIYSCCDFFYKPDILVFIDGSVHEKDDVKERDKEQRTSLKESGYHVIVYDYKDNLDDWVAKYKYIFKKVR